MVRAVLAVEIGPVTLQMSRLIDSLPGRRTTGERRCGGRSGQNQRWGASRTGCRTRGAGDRDRTGMASLEGGSLCRICADERLARMSEQADVTTTKRIVDRLTWAHLGRG